MTPHLFFDLDGTLTDPREGFVKCVRYALAGVGVPAPPDSELTRLIGPPLHDSLKSLLGPRQELLAQAARLYRERYQAAGMFENAVYPGVPEGLDVLKASGRTLWVVTSKLQVFATQVVRHFHLSAYFRSVYGSELSGALSDKGELIARVLEVEGIRATDATMIGDRSHDVVAARHNGMTAMGVLWGYGSEGELVGAGAASVHATMASLVARLVARE